MQTLINQTTTLQIALGELMNTAPQTSLCRTLAMYFMNYNDRTWTVVDADQDSDV